MSEEKKQQEMYQKMEVLAKNRVGAIPVGMLFEIPSKTIVDSIESFLESRGVDLDRDEVAVECMWDRAFDSSMRSGHDNGSNPFKIKVLTRVSQKDGKQYNGNEPLDKMRQIIAKNGSSDKRNGVRLESRKELSAAIAEFNDPNSQNLSVDEKLDSVEWFPWSGRKKKKTNIFSTYLDFDQVFRYIMGDNPDDHRNTMSYDIIDKRYYKDNNMEFTIRVVKQFDPKTYKQSRKDKFRNIRR